MARPTLYKPEYAEQALKLCRLGATQEEIMNFFSSDRTEEEFMAFWIFLRREDRNGDYAKRRADRSISRKKRSTPSSRLQEAVRSRMWAALKGRSDGRLFSRLGYSLEELISHLESRFSDGMSWDNYGKWHVDHVKPCAMFDQMDESQFAECWGLSNLQPLWAEDNIRKGAKYAGS